jgi:hypothetical protein
MWRDVCARVWVLRWWVCKWEQVPAAGTGWGIKRVGTEHTGYAVEKEKEGLEAG